MKKLYLIILFLFSVFCVYSQTLTPTPGTAPRSNSSVIPEDYNISVRSILTYPRFSDTTQANTYTKPSFDTLGRHVFTYDVMSDWVRVRNSVGGKKWEKIATSANIQPAMLGTILNQTSFPNLTGYTNTGSSATIVSNAINFPTGTSNFSQYLSYNYVTGLERWTQEIKFVANEKSASSTGVGIGIASINSSGGAYDLDMVAKFDMTNGANSGRISLFSGSGLPKLDSSAAQLSFSTGDTIILTAGRDLNEFTINVYNKTTNSANVNLIYNIIGTVVTPNTGNFSIWALGGDFTVYSYNIFSRQIVGANLFCLGDSKMGPYGLSDYYARSVTKLNSYFASTLSNCGNGDKTNETLQLVPEIISLRPRYVFLYSGSNDVRNGISASVTQANIDSITVRLQRAGILVYHGLFYETAISQTTLNNFLLANYASSYINTYDAILNCGDCLQSDGAHLNAVGHTKGSYAIQVSGLIQPDFRLSMKDETLSSGLLQSIHNGGNSFGRSFLIGSNEDFDFGIKRNNIKMMDFSEASIGTQPIINMPAFAFGANPVYTRASSVTMQSALYGGTTVFNIGVAGSDSANGAGIRLANFNVFGTNDFIQYQVPAGAFTRVGGYGAYLITNFSGAKIGTLNTDGQGATPIDFVVNLTTEATLTSTGFSVIDTLQVGKARSLATADSSYVKDPITGKVALAPYSGGGAGVNIYNSDGSLTGNRTVDLNNFSLTFQGDAPGPGVSFDLNAAVGGFQVLADTVAIQGTMNLDLQSGDVSSNATILSVRPQSSTYYSTDAGTSQVAGWETGTSSTPTVRLVASEDAVFDNSIYVADSIRFTGNVSTVISDTSVYKPLVRNVSTNTIVTGSWFGGSSGIGGTVNLTEVPFGSGVNTVKSEAAFTYDETNNILSVENITQASSVASGSVNSITANSLTTGTGISISSSSLTGGNLVNISSTSTALAAGNEGLNISLSGANASSSITATGARISVTNTGTGSTNIGLAVTASGAGTNTAIAATGNITTTATLTADGNVRLNGSGSGFIVNNRANPTAAVFTLYCPDANGMNFFSSSDVYRFKTDGELLVNTTTDNGTFNLQVNGPSRLAGSVTLPTAGNKLNIATGSNASIGVSAAMTAGTITISTTAVTSNSIIILTHASLGGTQGILSVGTITDGTSFVINSSNAADTGTVNWWIVN